MAYNPGTGIYTLPAVYLAVPGTTILATQHNTPLEDLEVANNYARPIIAGGTGANNAPAAVTNLGAVGNTGASQTITYVDAGAAIGPILDLYRDSASPLAADLIGAVDFNGRDSGAAKQLYARLYAAINDPTAASEDVSLRMAAVTAGALVDVMSMTGASITLSGSATDFTWNTSADTKSLSIFGGNALGANFQLYGATHATQANNYKFRTVGTVRYAWDQAALQHQFSGDANFSATVRVGQNTTDTPGVGNNTAGIGLNSTGSGYFSSAGSAIFANRTADGAVISIGASGVTQGTISVAGGTVSYNPFFGSHFSMPADGVIYPEIVPGTIVETIDELSDFEVIGDRLPRYKVSDTPGSKAVYGVFHRHDDDENRDEIGALGAYFIRIKDGHTVNRGDLIESNGDGCGRVQKDDILRSSTVGKVTSSTIVEKYKDGSYLVPCTLHAG